VDIVTERPVQENSKHARRERELEALKRRRTAQREHGQKSYAVRTGNRMLMLVDALAQRAGTYEHPVSPREAKHNTANDPLLLTFAKRYQVAERLQGPLARVVGKILEKA